MGSSLPKVLITEPIPDKSIEFLSDRYTVEIGEKGCFQNEDALIEAIPEYHALLCMLSNPITEDVLQAGTNLKVVANFAVGYNNIDVEAATKLGIKVANTPDVLTEACGDFAMGLLMAVSRKFNEAEQYLREGQFKGWEPLGFLGMELRGKTLGIIGMGRIGQAFAHRAKAFGMNITYHNRSPLSQQEEQPLQASYIKDLDQLISTSDVVSVNCPLTPETHHLINERRLGLMQEHALLINISRGPVVDEAALAHALHNKHIAGAGLDVFEEEPKVHPHLLTAPNCTMLPHIASATFETRDAIGMLAVQAIHKILNGDDPKSITNLVN